MLSEMQSHAELMTREPKVAALTQVLLDARADVAKMSQAEVDF